MNFFFLLLVIQSAGQFPREEALKVGPASFVKGPEVIEDQIAEIRVIKGAKPDVFCGFLCGGGHIRGHPEGGFTPLNQPLFPEGLEALPSGKHRRALLLYEAAEGGAGVLSQLASHIRHLSRAARTALQLMHFEFPEGEIAQDTLRDTGTGHHCEAGCYQCLLSYFNQPDHELIDRRNPEAIRFLCALSNASVTTAPALDSARVCETDSLGQWIETLDRLGLRKPDKLSVPIQNGTATAHALYSSTRALVFLTPPPPDAAAYAADRAHTLIQFPKNKEQWENIFAKYPDVFGNSKPAP